MKILLDFLAVIALFVAYRLTHDMIFATKMAMVATVGQYVGMRWLNIAVKPVHWLGFGLIFVLGGMAVFFHNPAFLQWKFTVLEWVMAAALIIGQLGFKKNMLQLLMGEELTLPPLIWSKLTWVWAGFFAFLGTLNWYVFVHYDYSVWLNFKLFGTLVLTVAFVIGLAAWLWRYLPQDER